MTGCRWSAAPAEAINCACEGCGRQPNRIVANREGESDKREVRDRGKEEEFVSYVLLLQDRNGVEG